MRSFEIEPIGNGGWKLILIDDNGKVFGENVYPGDDGRKYGAEGDQEAYNDALDCGELWQYYHTSKDAIFDDAQNARAA